MSEVQQYIGVSKNCKCNCLSQDTNAYSQKPHEGEHEIMDYRQIRKKLKTLKVPSLYKAIEEFTKTFKQQMSKLGKKIQAHQKSAEKAIKTKLISEIMDSKLSGDDEIQQLLQKIRNEEFVELKCGQISKVFSLLKEKEFQNREQLKFVIGDIYKDFKNQLIRQLDQLCSYYVFQSQLQKQQLKHVKLPKLVEESVVDAFTVESLNANDHENCNNLQLVMGKQKIGQKDEREQINSVWHIKTQQKLCESQRKEVKNDKQQYKPDQSIIDILAQMEKGEQIEIERNNESTIQIINQSQIHDSIMLIQKQTASKQIPLIKLSDLNRPQYNEEFATFNIRVKVIKVIFCSLQDKEEGLKIKFVGADETGCIICQTNRLDVKRDTEMVMEKTSLMVINRKTKFWEISSNDCRICKDSIIKEINKEKCFSKFESMNTFSFSLLGYSKEWLTIYDIKQAKNAKIRSKSKLSLIVRINQKTEGLNGLRCYVSDGTQKLWICLKKGGDCIKTGKVYLLQNILNGPNHQDVICQNATLLTKEITEEFGQQ